MKSLKGVKVAVYGCAIDTAGTETKGTVLVRNVRAPSCASLHAPPVPPVVRSGLSGCDLTAGALLFSGGRARGLRCWGGEEGRGCDQSDR